MKKQNIFWIAIFAAAALLVVSTGVVFAGSLMHGRSPFDPETEGFQPPFDHDDSWGPMHGRGPGRGQFGMGNPAMMDEMIDVVAEQTGLTVEEIESRLADGEHLFNIASDAGLDEDAFFDLMSEVRKDYFEEAVENGWMTEEHYQWMIERLDGAEFGSTEGFPCHPGAGNLSPMFNGTQRGSGRRW